MPFARPQDLNPSNVIVSKLTRIQDYILKKFDVELHMHLDRLEIPPQIYGM
jgi:TBC1 domain family protein 5